MPSREVFIEEVDRLLAVEKLLVGADSVQWQPGRNEDELCIKIPLEIAGEQFGQELVSVAFPQEPGKFSILLVHHIAVCRLDVVPDGEGHTNPLGMLGESQSTLVLGPHFHKWEMNRRLIESASKAQRLRMAEPYVGTRKFMSALRWFCAETKIVIPHGVSFELPKRERLL